MFSSHEKFKEILELMLQQSDEPCITIIMPLPRNGKANEVMREVVATAERLAAQQFPSSAKTLVEDLEAVVESFSFTPRDDAAGIYVSEKAQFTTTFPFPLTERISVDKGFDLIDLLYLHQFDFSYALVTLSEKTGAIYAGALNRLKLLHEVPTPENIEDKPESVASYARNKEQNDLSDMFVKSRKNRLAFFHHIDNMIDHDFSRNEPLVVYGNRYYTSRFLNRSNHVSRIVSVLNQQTYRPESTNLHAVVWSAIHSAVLEKLNDEKEDLEEKMAEGSAVNGLHNVWLAVNENRGQVLLVERDFDGEEKLERPSHTGYFFRAPRRQFISARRALNGMAGKLLAAGGKVLVMEKETLQEHDGIALVTNE